MTAAEEEGLHGQRRFDWGFDLELAVEVHAGGVGIADEGGVVPVPAWRGRFAGEGFIAAAKNELALGVEAEGFAGAGA